MMVKAQILRNLVAAVVLIALSVAPSITRAHGGHAHHDSAHGPAAVAGGQHIAVVQPQSMALPPASLESASFGQSAGPASLDRNCVTGCCISACAACCVAGLPGFAELLPLAGRVMRISLPASRTAASREPDCLSRPPKALT